LTVLAAEKRFFFSEQLHRSTVNLLLAKYIAASLPLLWELEGLTPFAGPQPSCDTLAGRKFQKIHRV
jgi:hypothetical protein